jgi:ubiquinone/menaquinone biosynthesis C-methylase UbiE
MTKQDRKSKSSLIDEIKNHVSQTFDLISVEFDSTRYKPWPETVDYLKTVKPSARIIDIGVGNGRNAVYAARNGLEVLGIDFAGKILRLARNKFNKISRNESIGHVEFIQSDFGSLPLRSDSFDGAIFVASLHHIPSGEERMNAVQELYRVLKVGGTALISVWDLDQPRFKEELMRQLYGVCCAPDNSEKAEVNKTKKAHPPPYEFGDVWVPWQSKDGTVHYRFYHLFYHNELIQLMESTDFKIHKYFRRSDNHNVIVQKK